MEILIRREQDATVAVISGEIDGKTAPQAQAELLPLIGTSPRIIMDMNGVTYMSSAGLRMLLLLYRQGTARDAKLVLVGLSEEISDTMAMTGFLDFFLVVSSVEAALEA